MAWNGYRPGPPPPPPPPAPPATGVNPPFDAERAGAGVDHAAPNDFSYAFFGGGPWAHRDPWGGAWGGRGPWGRRGRRGRHGRHDHDNEETPEDENSGEDITMNEKADTPGTMREGGDDAPDPPESVPNPHPHHHGPGGRGRGRCGRGGMRGRHAFGFGPGARHHHGPGPHHGPDHHHHGPPPPYGGFGGHGPHGGFPWGGFGGLMNAFANHPLAQGFRDYMNRNEGMNNEGDDGVDTFTPPVDLFHDGNGWVLHIAVPGAKKEDVGVNWDPEKSLLSVSGVVHRPGTEEFLQGLVSGERRVGLFQRDVRLPPEGVDGARDRDEVDAEGIKAKMEDGILVVTVPLVEREWTEVRKVDIE